MNCKKCQAELDEGMKFCPQCGAETAEAPAEENTLPEAPVLEEAPAVEEAPVQAETPSEEAPAKKGLGAGKIALLVVLAIAAIAVVIALVTGGAGKEPAETTAPSDPTGTGETVAATVPADGNPDDVTCKGTYSVSDDEIVADAETVVATMGDAVLTNADLQVYYWMQIYDFLNQYASYASMFGLDYTQSLDTQISMEGTLTWQQYFLDSALDMWCNYQAMCLEAEEQGFELAQEYAEYLAELPTSMESSAVSMGYDSALGMIQADMGAGATMNAYLDYLYNYYLGYMYYGETLEAVTVTDAEVEAYFDEHAADYEANGLVKDDSIYVDARHILLMPEGGTTAEDGTTTYSEEEWAACKKAAEDVLNEWLSGEKTEDAFAELANQYSEDGGSNTNGGLYTEIYEGQMVEPFENWCFDPARQYGDYGIVQTTYGYHVMFFVDSESVWYATAHGDLMVEKGDAFLQSVLEKHPAEIDYSAMKLGVVDLAAAG